MIKESSGAATKDTRSVDERHKVYEEHKGVLRKSCKAACSSHSSALFNEVVFT